MKSIILAAGRGSRMKELTDDIPKCLVPLHGKPLIEWQIDALRASGIDEIALVTGYKADMLQSYHLKTFHNARWRETNMVSSLACAAEWLQSSPCIVSYSDLFFEPEAISSLIESSSNLAVTYDVHWRQLWEKRFDDPLLDAETFRLKKDRTLAEIGNRPTSLTEIEGQYMGLLRVTPKAWQEISRIRNALPPAQRDTMHMTATLQRIIEENRLGIDAIPFHGKWGEIDSAQDLEVYSVAAQSRPLDMALFCRKSSDR